MPRDNKPVNSSLPGSCGDVSEVTTSATTLLLPYHLPSYLFQPHHLPYCPYRPSCFPASAAPSDGRLPLHYLPLPATCLLVYRRQVIDLSQAVLPLLYSSTSHRTENPQQEKRISVLGPAGSAKGRRPLWNEFAPSRPQSPTPTPPTTTSLAFLQATTA